MAMNEVERSDNTYRTLVDACRRYGHLGYLVELHIGRNAGACEQFSRRVPDSDGSILDESRLSYITASLLHKQGEDMTLDDVWLCVDEIKRVQGAAQH